MALDFPSSPTNGQTYTSNGRAWTWNSSTSTWESTNPINFLSIATGMATPDYIQFDTSATNTTAVGKLYWDAGEGSFLYTLSGGNVTQNLHPGSELVYNGTGSSLTKGQVVYLSGAQGQRPSVALALATSEATSARTIGIVAETIANGAEGWIRTIGILEGFDTSAFTEGAQLYLSGTTAGAMTATKPVAPTHLVYTARVIKSHATAGRILVDIQNGYELDELHDVAISSPSTGQTIVYNSTTSLWSNGTLPVSGGGTGATNLTSGYLLKGNGTSAVSASVVYDDGTNVGIGTSSPTARLTAKGGITQVFNYSGAAASPSETFDWPFPALEVTSYGDFTSQTMLALTLPNDGGYYLDYSVWNFKLQQTAGSTTSAGVSGCTFGGPGYLGFAPGGSERMRIDSAGNVGIGTSSPGFLCDVNGYFRSQSMMSGNDTDGWGRIVNAGGALYIQAGSLNSGSATAQPIIFTNMYGGSERMRIDSAGNVGIGLADPSQKLDVAGGISLRPGGSVGADAVLTADASSGANGISLIAGFASGGYGPIKFVTSATERMRIDSAGNVGIGDTNPGGTGADKSLVVATSGNLCIVKGYTTSTASTASARFDWAIGRANAYVISALNDNNGYPYFIINTGPGVTGPMYMQNGTGGVYLSRNATSWTGNSDERVKDIIEPIVGAVDKLATLRTVFGKYKDDVNGVRRPFLIAQDLQKVYPEVVTEPAPLPGQDFAPLGVSYTDLVPVLVAAINELSERLAALEAK